MDPEAEAAALRAQQVEEQRGAIEDLKNAFEASEERQRASQAEIIAKLSQLVVEKTNSEGESGGPATVGAAGRGAAPSRSSAHSDDNENEGDGDAAEADPYQLGSGGPARDFVPLGEQPSHTPGDSAKLHLNNMMKTMKPPVFQDETSVESWKRESFVYMKLNKFSCVFSDDPYVDVGSEENSRESLMAGGVPGDMYDRQLAAYVFLSQALKRDVDRAIFYRHASPREIWEKILEYHGPTTNDQKRALQSQNFWL